MLRIERVEPDDPGAAQLIDDLDAELIDRYAADVEVDGGIDRHALNQLGADATFLVARLDGDPVGCGALRRKDGETAEVKRMYVAPSGRGRGVARAVLAALEAAAADQGFRRVVLETGIRQPEAIALYESAGWRRIDSYGSYRDSPLSRCYEKLLPPSSTSPRS